MPTLQEHKRRTTSEKIVLAWLEPSQRLFSWDAGLGGVYSRAVSHYVVGVRQDATALTEVSSIAAVNSDGKWFFDPATMMLYVRSAGSANPGSLWTDVTYRLFFSNAPVDLPATLTAGGYEVPYDARLASTSKFKEQFSDDQKGIALEGSGSVTLHNNDAYFEPIYDRLVWENKACRIFSYFRDMDLTELVTLFNGVVTDKNFEPAKVGFTVKNFIYKLRSELDLPVYSDADGTLPASLIGKPKRRLYGRVDGLSCAPIANMQTTYDLRTISSDERTTTPITVTTATGSNRVTASSTDVHKELCAGDALKISGTTFKVKSLARIDVGLDTQTDVTLSRIGTFTCRLAFTGIDTSGVSINDSISLSVLNNAQTDTKAKCIGLFTVTGVNAAYIEFGWTSPGYASMTTDTFKSSSVEIVVTRSANTAVFTTQSAAATTYTAVACTVTPTVAYRRFNREWLLAHHALSTVSTTVTGITGAVKFSVDTVDGMYAGDLIRIAGGSLSTIVSLDRAAKQITVADVILPFPTIGTTVERLGVQAVTFKERPFTQFTDFSPDYDADVGAKLVFTTLAEFNATPAGELPSKVYWLYGSKQVFGTNGVFAGLKPRDWVASSTESDVWYEISEKVSDSVIILNTAYQGTTGNLAGRLRQPTYMADQSVVVADVYGKTTTGAASDPLIVTGAQVVRDMMTDAGLDAIVDEASFALAAEDCPYVISMALPSTPTGNAPTIRDVINGINDSVVGSLYNAIDGTIQYRCLDASRPESEAVTLTEVDAISYSVSSDSSIIYRKVLVRFAARDADTVTEKATYSVEQSESELVTNSGIDGEVSTIQTYLYDRDDAQTLAQRTRFMHELASSRLELTTGLLLVDASLNDLVSVTLDRIYPRLGTPDVDRSKTGLISSISKNGLSCVVVIDDLGNLFNRVAAIAPNDADDFADADATARRFSGYITDDDGLQSGDETTFNANLIG